MAIPFNNSLTPGFTIPDTDGGGGFSGPTNLNTLTPGFTIPDTDGGGGLTDIGYSGPGGEALGGEGGDLTPWPTVPPATPPASSEKPPNSVGSYRDWPCQRDGFIQGQKYRLTAQSIGWFGNWNRYQNLIGSVYVYTGKQTGFRTKYQGFHTFEPILPKGANGNQYNGGTIVFKYGPGLTSAKSAASGIFHIDPYSGKGFRLAGCFNVVADIPVPVPPTPNPQTPPGPPIDYEPPVVVPPIGPPAPPAGSGDCFAALDPGIVQEELVITPLWSNDQKYLQTPSTASLLIASGTVNYCLDVYNQDPDDDECEEVQYRIIYADYDGKGDKDLGGLDNETLSKAMYTQYAHILLPHGTEKFTIDGNEEDYVYIIDVKRDRYKSIMDPGNWQLSLASASFSSDSGNSNLTDMQTASFVEIAHTFIDSSRAISGSVNFTSKVYDVRLGTIEGGLTYTPSGSTSLDTGSYGLFYPNHGMIVLAGSKMDSELGFNTNRNIEKDGFNSYRLQHAIKLVTDTTATDASGDALGFWGRAMELQYVTYYFINVPWRLFNFSNNPTFTTGSEGLIVDSFVNTEKSYFTSIGLYSPNRELMAVGKLSQPIMSTATDESLFTVKLTH